MVSYVLVYMHAGYYCSVREVLMIQTSNDSPLELTSTEKLVKCVVLHSIGGVVLLSCMMPSLDHPPIVWLLRT